MNTVPAVHADLPDKSSHTHSRVKESPEPRGTKVLHQALLVAPCALCPHDLCHTEVYKLWG